MRAISYPDYGATPAMVDLPEPVCSPDGAVVAVRATGVCRSDWHAWRGHDPVPLPMVPGHEQATARIEAIRDGGAVVLFVSHSPQQVLELLLGGASNGEIAKARKTAIRTVANQVASLFRKFGVGSRAELAARLSA
mgnify:CR=1 FL=1